MAFTTGSALPSVAVASLPSYTPWFRSHCPWWHCSIVSSRDKRSHGSKGTGEGAASGEGHLGLFFKNTLRFITKVRELQTHVVLRLEWRVGVERKVSEK